MRKVRKNAPPTDAQPKQKGLLAEVSDTGFVGMWKDRADIGDSSEFARKLRERAQAPVDAEPQEK